MTENNEPHSGKTNVRRFRVVRAPDKPSKKTCEACEADYIGCPECEKRGLIPNATALEFVTTQKFHHGRCHRHGQHWRRCTHYVDTEILGDHAGERIPRFKVYRIVVIFTVLSFWLGVIAGIAFVLIQRALLAH